MMISSVSALMCGGRTTHRLSENFALERSVTLADDTHIQSYIDRIAQNIATEFRSEVANHDQSISVRQCECDGASWRFHLRQQRHNQGSGDKAE